MGIVRPNLWITGLPKAGTSSIFSNLSQHRSISGSFPKETFFLLDQSSPLLRKENNFWHDGAAGWNMFFTRSSDCPRYYLEGTTHLFFQNESLSVLNEFHPGSRFIIMLREPAERIYSSFVYTRDTLVRLPAEISFGRYVSDLLAERPLTYIKHPASEYVLSRELEFSSYHTFLKGWYNTFNREHIFVGLFEDFVADSSIFMERLFGFLELEEMKISASHSNPTVAYKRPYLHKVVLQAARYFPLANGLRNKLKAAYLKRYSASRPSITEEDQEAKEMLRRYFSADNERLRTDFSLDISKWS